MEYPLVTQYLMPTVDWGDGPPELIALAERYRRADFADGTLRTKESILRGWDDFCARYERCPLPTDELTLCAYVSEAGAKGAQIGTIQNRLSTLAGLHKAHGYTLPRDGHLRPILAAIARTSVKKKALPLAREELLAMLARARRRRLVPTGARDAALLTFLWHAAERAGEVGSAKICDVKLFATGMHLEIPHSKGDPYNEGQRIFLPADADHNLCPIRALHHHLSVSGIESGHLFRPQLFYGNARPRVTPDRGLSTVAINRLVKDYVREIGLNPAGYSTRSLRRGWATNARIEGESMQTIQDRLRHRDQRTTRGYVDAYHRDNYTALLGI